MLTPSQRELLLQGEEEIDQVLEENEEIVPFKYSITSYGADYPVDGLVARVRTGDITIPVFQRGYVWSLKEASRFIESLLLGLPTPSIFLSKESGTQKLLVIDGQQRLFSLKYFYDGIWPVTRKEFTLKNVDPRFEGKTYKTISDEDRRSLDDSIIHAVVIKQDEPSEDESSIYHVFERLNTSGVSLTAQEIRAAIYHGPFNDLLKELNQNKDWRSIYGPINKLMRDQELILRFLALYFDESNYSRPMKAFLNTFMAQNRALNRISREQMISAFVPTIGLVYQAIGRRAFRLAKAFNAAVFDAVMAGIATRLAKGPVRDKEHLKASYLQLLVKSEFLTAAEQATSDEESVHRRLKLARDTFEHVD